MNQYSSLLRAFLSYLEIERGFSPNTVSAYRGDCERFIDQLRPECAHDPRQVGEKDVFDFVVAERKRGNTVASVRRGLSAVKSFFRFLVRERVVDDNPAQRVENPGTWQTLPSVLDEDQVRRLLDAVVEHPSRYPLRDRALLELTYATGLRVSEISSLTTSSIHKDLGILRCFGKGSKERVVPASKTSLEAVAKYESEERPKLARYRVTNTLFLSRAGKPLGREVINALVKKYSALAGLPSGVTPHILRHSLATHLIRGGADLRIVQEILGHANVETTEIYTHIDRSQLKKAHREYHPRG